MLENLDDLIDHNLKLLYSTPGQSMWDGGFQNLDGRDLNESERLAEIMCSKGLVDINVEEVTMTEFGFNVSSLGGWRNHLNAKTENEINEQNKQREREQLEFEKSKVDLELAKKTLKDLPRTKRFAWTSLVISAILLLKEIIELFLK